MDYEQLAHRHTERLEEVEARLAAIEYRVDGNREHIPHEEEIDPFIVPVVEDMSRIEEQSRGWYMALAPRLEKLEVLLVDVSAESVKWDVACQERDEELRARIAEMEARLLALKETGNEADIRIARLEVTVANLVTILEGQKKQIDGLLQDMYSLKLFLMK